MPTLNALSKTDEQAIEGVAKIWVEACDMPCPHDAWLLGLVRANGLDASEYAIRRTGRKLYAARQSGEMMSADSARRYCKATAENCAAGEFPDRQAPPARQLRETAGEGRW